jgi:uncharacterized protein (TIGR02466 family)
MTRAAFEAGLAALDTGDEDAALPLVEAALRITPGDARLWQVKALLHRSIAEMNLATAAFDRAAAIAPRDASIALGRAHTALEAGQPAVARFTAALALAKDRKAVLPGLAAARLADVGAQPAIAGLIAELRNDPLWLEGHWLLARMRWQAQDHQGFMNGIDVAQATLPRHPGLWQVRVFTLMQANRHADALEAITNARRALMDDAAFAFEAAACLSESGQAAAADRALAALPLPADARTAVVHLRHALRTGRAEAAARMALAFREAAEGHLVIPYLSLAWRLLDDPRCAGLDDIERLVGVYDLTGDVPLASLAARLRALHVVAGAPLEQSVRGGTQTDSAVLSRTEPEFIALRAAIDKAVRSHVATIMPEAKVANRRVRLTGSWSVRLTASGHHSNHVHPAGWFSSAFYAVLPDAEARGGSNAGWLALGAPPVELGLDLKAQRFIEPRVGQLVLFPSTMWHGTVPFAGGERISVAFDVGHATIAASPQTS